MNLDMSKAVAGEHVDNVIIGPVGPANGKGREDKATEHGQDGQEGPPPLTEDIAKGDLKCQH